MMWVVSENVIIVCRIVLVSNFSLGKPCFDKNRIGRSYWRGPAVDSVRVTMTMMTGVIPWVYTKLFLISSFLAFIQSFTKRKATPLSSFRGEAFIFVD